MICLVKWQQLEFFEDVSMFGLELGNDKWDLVMELLELDDCEVLGKVVRILEVLVVGEVEGENSTRSFSKHI